MADNQSPHQEDAMGYMTFNEKWRIPRYDDPNETQHLNRHDRGPSGDFGVRIQHG